MFTILPPLPPVQGKGARVPVQGKIARVSVLVVVSSSLSIPPPPLTQRTPQAASHWTAGGLQGAYQQLAAIGPPTANKRLWWFIPGKGARIPVLRRRARVPVQGRVCSPSPPPPIRPLTPIPLLSTPKNKSGKGGQGTSAGEGGKGTSAVHNGQGTVLSCGKFTPPSTPCPYSREYTSREGGQGTSAWEGAKGTGIRKWTKGQGTGKFTNEKKREKKKIMTNFNT